MCTWDVKRQAWRQCLQPGSLNHRFEYEEEADGNPGWDNGDVVRSGITIGASEHVQPNEEYVVKSTYDAGGGVWRVVLKNRPGSYPVSWFVATGAHDYDEEKAESDIKSIENEGMDALAQIPDQLRQIFGDSDNWPGAKQKIGEIIDTVEEMTAQAYTKIDSTINALKSLAIAEEMKRAATSVKTDPAPPVVNDLGQWWMNLAEGEFGAIAAKMREYGGGGRALDLVEIGRALASAGTSIPSESDEVFDANLQELGVYFYLVGKFARWTAAVAEGRPVSDDTLHDIGVYVRMAQRIRAVGGWPS